MPMEDDYIETQATSAPHFDEAEPHPSSPAGQVHLVGSAARRAGPTAVRAFLLAALVATTIALVIEIT